ncbi:MFS transporter [Ensifer adhaerens]|uniref:MFS transporter n=1 Tax=Ensifer adhaerens TaxID=106592 RepID=UPI000DC40B7E|nr:MFS transporter [Ensifer adhaerens]RAR98917.1 EmrB/QacA subfamily drug resistance transporter [Ensifer adhaerens]
MTQTETGNRYVPARPKGRKFLTLFAVCVSVFMLPLDYTVVAVALHDIQTSLNGSYSDLQWVVNGYTLTFAAFMLAGGGLADLFGRRRIFSLGLLVFATSSLGCGLAPTAMILNIARAAQGMGAALLFSAAVPLLVQEFTHPGERARAFGIFGAVVGIGAGLGPFIGGIIVSLAGWRMAFLVNVPVSLVVALVTFAGVSESRDPAAKSVDWWGTLTFTSANFFLIYALIAGNEAGWGSAAITGSLTISVALFAVFAKIELAHSYPMFDLQLLRRPEFIGVSIPPLVLSISFWGVFLFAPLYFQTSLGYSPLQAGLAALPFAVPLFFMGPVGGWLAVRMSSAHLLAVGQALVGIGSLLLLVATKDSGWSGFLFGAAVSGIGCGLINGEMTNAAMSIVPPERSGMASGINGTMRQIGVSLGFAGLGAILAYATRDALSESLATFALPANQLAGASADIVKGDIVAAASRLPASVQIAFPATARAALFHGFMTIAFVAGVVGLAGALATLLLLRKPTRPS